VGRARGARTDHLVGDRQVGADDAVLVKAGTVAAEGEGNGGAEGRKEEGAGAVRALLVGAFLEVHRDRHVEDIALADKLAKFMQQRLLQLLNLWRRPVRDEDHPVLVAERFIQGTREGVEAAGEEQHLIGNEALVLAELEVAIGAGLARMGDEGEVVEVVGQEPEGLFQSADDLLPSPQFGLSHRDLESEMPPPPGTHSLIDQSAASDRRIGGIDEGSDLQQVERPIRQVADQAAIEMIDAQGRTVRGAVDLEGQRTVRAGRYATTADAVLNRGPVAGRAHRGSS